VLWVNAESPYQTPKDFFEALKKGRRPRIKMGGTAASRKTDSSRPLIEKAAGKKMTYVPYKGGGEVAVQLRGQALWTPPSTTRSRPESHWRGRQAARAGAFFDSKEAVLYDKVTATQSWADLPTLLVSPGCRWSM